MTIEIRYTDDKGSHCDLGPLTNSGYDPAVGIPDLMLIDRKRLQHLLTVGPLPRHLHGGTSSATTEGEKTFLHIDYDGKPRETWELFEARRERAEDDSVTDYIGKRVDRTGKSAQ